MLLPMNTQHVPAWKRLGLKLKYANDNAPPQPSELPVLNGGNKRKQDETINEINGADGLHQRKKPRIPREVSHKKLNEELRATSDSPKLPRRKKSVSFTADTKIEDGDTAQTIQFWTPDLSNSTSNPPGTEDHVDDVVTTPSKSTREKKAKKPKSRRNNSNSAVPRKATAAVTYINQFLQDHSSWKFNKNHETWILKHALSVESIPSANNIALAAYLQGLKSQGARMRLVEQSRDQLKAGTGPAEIDEDLKARLAEATTASKMGEFTQTTHPAWLKDLDRARLILLSLGESFQLPEESVRKNGQVSQRVKKNKSRTSRIEVSDSSTSDSDSESDSEESSDKPVEKQNPQAPSKDQVNGDDIDATSSSDSTSESSDETSSSEDSSSRSEDE